MHLQPVFQEARAYVNGVSDDLFEKGLCLPSGTAMTNEELLRVCSLIKSCWL
jgi:UDP-N-acetylbacillosamine transaminase